MALLAIRNILDDFESRFLFGFLKKHRKITRRVVKQALKIFLSPKQNRHREEKEHILDQLDEMKMDVDSFCDEINNIYAICSTHTNLFRKTNDSTQTLNSSIIGAGLLSDTQKACVDVISWCLMNYFDNVIARRFSQCKTQ